MGDVIGVSALGPWRGEGVAMSLFNFFLKYQFCPSLSLICAPVAVSLSFSNPCHMFLGLISPVEF